MRWQPMVAGSCDGSQLPTQVDAESQVGSISSLDKFHDGWAQYFRLTLFNCFWALMPRSTIYVMNTYVVRNINIPIYLYIGYFTLINT